MCRYQKYTPNASQEADAAACNSVFSANRISHPSEPHYRFPVAWTSVVLKFSLRFLECPMRSIHLSNGCLPSSSILICRFYDRICTVSPAIVISANCDRSFEL